MMAGVREKGVRKGGGRRIGKDIDHNDGLVVKGYFESTARILVIWVKKWVMKQKNRIIPRVDSLFYLIKYISLSDILHALGSFIFKRFDTGKIWCARQGLHHEFDIGGDGSAHWGDGVAMTYPTYPEFRFLLGFRPLHFAKGMLTFFFKNCWKKN